MNKIIGIRREDKNKWERRVPLIPADVKELKEKHGIHTIVQPSPIRIFPDEEYEKAGAEINEDLSRADIILAVKEIPIKLYEENKTYVFFSHVIKGQDYNMPMLQHMMDLNVNSIDYERIVDENNRRLLFFGRYAGLAGMIETLAAFAKKLELQGYQTPLSRIKQPYEYASLEEAKKEIEAIGKEIDENGFPQELSPIVVGFAGYGNVSRGAQEIFNLLPHKTMSAAIMDEMYENFTADNFNFYKVVFSEDDLVKPKEGEFDLQDYYKNPQRYVSQFERYLPFLDVLVNCIYWTPDYPYLVTKEFLKNETALKSNPKIKVIGDISCDIDGSVEICHKITKPDSPVFTYFPQEDSYADGTHMNGVTVMAVDNLPCEFSAEASTDFSKILKGYIPNLVQTEFNAPYDELDLSAPMKRALILHKGKLTKDYRYLEEFLK